MFNSIMKLKNVFIKLSIFVILLKCADCQAKNTTAVCDKTNPTVGFPINSSGELNYTVKGPLKNVSCVWNITIDKTVNETRIDSIILIIDKLILHPNDSLTIAADNGTIVWSNRGYLSAGVLLTGLKSITLNLTFSGDDYKRNFEIDYNWSFWGASNSRDLQNIKDAGSFSFAYYFAKIDKPFNFSIALQVSQTINDKILWVNFGSNFSLPKDSFITVENAQNVMNGTQLGKGNIIPQDILSNTTGGKSLPLKITINNFNMNDLGKGFTINYDVVTASCSGSKTIADYNSCKILPLPDTESMDSFRCVYLIDHNDANAKLELNITDFSIMNPSDLISIRDGDRRTNNSLADISEQSLNDWKKQYIYSSGPKLMIIYDSPILNVKTISFIPMCVSALEFGGNYNSDFDLIVKEKSKSKPPFVFNFITNDNQTAVVFDSSKQLPGNKANPLLIFYNDIKNDERSQFTALYSGDYPPAVVASNGNKIRIIVNQTVDITLKVVQQKYGCDWTSKGDSDSYMNTITDCNKQCHWFIPKRASNGTVLLQINRLTLASEDALKLKKLSDKPDENVLQLNGSPNQTNFNAFPDVYLLPDSAYQLTSMHNLKCKPNETALTIAASFTHLLQRNSIVKVNLKQNQNATIESDNYPNFYPIGESQKWFIDSDDNDSVLITFTDMQLSLGHNITITAKSCDPCVYDSKTIDLPKDALIKSSFGINLNADPNKGLGSGRGFRANLSLFECAETFNTESGSFATKGYPKPANISNCIWFVQLPKTKDQRLISFNISYGDGSADDSQLIIYDANTLREVSHFLNFGYFNKTKPAIYNTSIDSMIVVYKLKNGKKEGQSFNITYEPKVCNDICGNGRCRLKQFICNDINDCGNWADERHCNTTIIPPPLPPAPVVKSTGVNGWVVVLVICPLCIALGVLGTLFGPPLLRRFRGRRYSEFQDFSEVS